MRVDEAIAIWAPWRLLPGDAIETAKVMRGTSGEPVEGRTLGMVEPGEGGSPTQPDMVGRKPE